MDWQDARYKARFVHEHQSIDLAGPIRADIYLTEIGSILNPLLARAEREARTCPLTGMPNTRAYDERAEEELIRAARSEQPLSIINFDVREFKAINDTYGHKTGDLILQQIAHTLMGRARKTDFYARIGGDEFLGLLPETTMQEAEIVAGILSDSIARETSLALPKGLPVFVDYGIAQVTPQDTSAPLLAQYDHALVTADKRMYKRKQQRL